ncbi:MAG: hypothetical protein RMJ31_06175 [Nitrososphaerota archaeon]|nr:hypothetical protein [Nitrososphaerota archaeon]
MDAHEIIDLALKLSGFKTLPSDSGIHVDGKGIQRVLFSIDVSTSELLLAKQLKCDAVIGHHPLGDALVNFHKVLDRHVDFMVQHGVPLDVARSATEELKSRIMLRSHYANYSYIISAAQHLNIPLLNIHVPLDELGRRLILNRLTDGKPKVVKDIIRIISDIDEFKIAATRPELILGSMEAPCEKMALVHAAGTNGGYSITKAYFTYGVKTVIYVHFDYNDLKRLKDEGLVGNLIIMGHIAADSVGINVFIRELVKKGVEVIPLGIIGHHKV